MNYKTKDFIFYGMLSAALVLTAANTIERAQASPNINIEDHTKTVIKRIPHTYEVCSEVDVPADKTKDTLLGAIIGGAIGQNITKDLPDGATAGAIIGGILGNQNSTNIGGKQMRCTKNTRYEDTMETMYSHSTITFSYQGKTYKIRFQK